jgi:hypothetical protein
MHAADGEEVGLPVFLEEREVVHVGDHQVAVPVRGAVERDGRRRAERPVAQKDAPVDSLRDTHVHRLEEQAQRMPRVGADRPVRADHAHLSADDLQGRLHADVEIDRALFHRAVRSHRAAGAMVGSACTIDVRSVHRRTRITQSFSGFESSWM